MKILGLDDKVHTWNPMSAANAFGSSSTYHVRVRELLKKLFPFETILEEVSLPGTQTRVNSTLRVDFYIPKKKIAVEVHGEQHYEFNSHFHGSDKNFKLACIRDKNKAEWFNRNNIALITLPFDKTDEEWSSMICQ